MAQAEKRAFSVYLLDDATCTFSPPTSIRATCPASAALECCQLHVDANNSDGTCTIVRVTDADNNWSRWVVRTRYDVSWSVRPSPIPEYAYT